MSAVIKELEGRIDARTKDKRMAPTPPFILTEDEVIEIIDEIRYYQDQAYVLRQKLWRAQGVHSDNE